MRLGKSRKPDEELKIIVFSPFVLHYINKVLRILTSWLLEHKTLFNYTDVFVKEKENFHKKKGCPNPSNLY